VLWAIFLNEMATDGIKIVDGDTGHDTYWGIMDLYDSGADSEKIENEFPLVQSDYVDDFENEVYVTSCGLALWEIGLMTQDKVNYIQTVIDKGATVTEWSRENEKDGRARKRELEKYFQKISHVNNKVRPRKKYRKITHLHFQDNDILAFKVRDGKYRAVICFMVDQYRGQCNYNLVLTTYNSSIEPTADELLKAEILGIDITSGFSPSQTILQQPGIEKLWKLAGGINNHFFGLATTAVSHSDFITFKDNFEVTGTIKIKDGLNRIGSHGGVSSFDRFEDIFADLESHIESFRFRRYPIKLVCDIGA